MLLTTQRIFGGLKILLEFQLGQGQNCDERCELAAFLHFNFVDFGAGKFQGDPMPRCGAGRDRSQGPFWRNCASLYEWTRVLTLSDRVAVPCSIIYRLAHIVPISRRKASCLKFQSGLQLSKMLLQRPDEGHQTYLSSVLALAVLVATPE